MSKRKRKPWDLSNSRSWQSSYYNNTLFITLRNHIISLFVNRYKWVGLPESCDAWFLEKTLFEQGCASIAKNPNDGKWYTLQMGGNMLAPDEYGYPSLWTAIGVNGIMRYECTKATGIYVYDNFLMYPPIQEINVWCRELVDIILTMNSDRARLKVPVVISGMQDKRLDMENYVKQIAGGEAFVISTNGIDNIDVKVQNTQNLRSFQSDLWASYFNVWNCIYDFAGIEHVDYKKERRVEAEIEQTSEPTKLKAIDGLAQRRRAADWLNKINPFFDIKVVWNQDNVSDNYNFMHNLPLLVDSDVKRIEA